MSEVINISDNVYPIEDVIVDLVEIKDTIKDLVIVTISHEGTASVSHTGLSLTHMALACKLLDKEFNNMLDLNESED